MKKFGMIFALLFTLVSCIKLEAFDHIAEWQAIKAIYDKKMGRYSARQSDVDNKAELLEIIVLILVNNELDSTEIDFNDSYINELSHLKQRLIVELRYKTYEKAEVIESIKQQMVEQINRMYEDKAEEIIAGSKFLSDKSSGASLISKQQTILDVMIATNNSLGYNSTPLPETSSHESYTPNKKDESTKTLLRAVPTCKKSHKWLTSATTAFVAGLFYKLSTTEKFQKDPRLALVAKLASGTTAAYGLYNLIFKK